MNTELLTLFIGIIAVCMVIITSVIGLVGFHTIKTMQKTHEFIAHVQNELSFVSTKAALTLHEVNEFLQHLKGQTESVSDKSLQALHEIRDLVSYIHEETKDLALKASNGIAKVTVGTLAIGALAQMFKKKSND
ncbi:MAG TPA: hypothetical protein VFX57_06530 [Sulfuricurvum sp.]|nr:hypothetical protein [Sulfuricurvum sp.]